MSSKSTALWVVGLLSLAGTAHAQSEPTFVKLSWMQEDASTTMAISWTTQADVGSTIEYGINATSENQATGASSRLPGVGWMHEVELTGLTPNTTYKYRVGSTGAFSPEYVFKTAPNDLCTPFSFVGVGDGRSQLEFGPSPSWEGILNEANATGPDLMINSGDLIRTGDDIDQWNNWLIASESVNPTLPHMPSIGNHDDGPGEGDGAFYNQVFSLPRNNVTNTEDYYHFVYNNALFIAISTQTFRDWTAQANYVRTVSALHPNKWKIVYFHHPIYTSETFGIGHEPDENGQNAELSPAFDDAGIDVVVMGHNHHYERFEPMRHDPNNVESGQVVANYGNGPNDGRMYVISGGSGSFTNPLIGAGSGANGSAMRAADHHFVKFAIAGNTLHYSVISTNTGNPGGGNGVLETVTINRPGPDPCSQQGTDQDADGYLDDVDCDDTNEDVNPGAAEICGNAVDEDCDGNAQDCPMPIPDMDNDGSTADRDCDDNDPARYPENPEVECDGIDNDCDCFETCNGQTTDVCNPSAPDAGTGADAQTADSGSTDSGNGAPPADAGQGPADSGAPDSGQTATPDSGCSCRGSGQSTGSGLLWAGLPLLLLAFRRR